MERYTEARIKLNEMYEDYCKQRPMTNDPMDLTWYRGILQGMKMSMFHLLQMDKQAATFKELR